MVRGQKGISRAGGVRTEGQSRSSCYRARNLDFPFYGTLVFGIQGFRVWVLPLAVKLGRSRNMVLLCGFLCGGRRWWSCGCRMMVGLHSACPLITCTRAVMGVVRGVTSREIEMVLMMSCFRGGSV